MKVMVAAFNRVSHFVARDEVAEIVTKYFDYHNYEAESFTVDFDLLSYHECSSRLGVLFGIYTQLSSEIHGDMKAVKRDAFFQVRRIHKSEWESFTTARMKEDPSFLTPRDLKL